MNKINSSRIIESFIEIKNELFPYIIINPKYDLKKCKKLVIHIQGLNGNSSFIKYFDNKCFDNVYLFSYDQRAQGKNLLKPSQNFRKYINDLNNIIEKLIRDRDIEEIYLIGESWGSCLAFLYNKYYPNKIKGTLGWNMPYEVIDVNKNQDNDFILKIKVLITLLTGIDTYEKSILTEGLTNNPSLKRLILHSRRYKISNKVIIAAWRSFKKSWKFFLKNQEKNFLYVQSEQDILKSKKIFKKNINIEKIIFLKGTHLLSFDSKYSKNLFNIIENFIK